MVSSRRIQWFVGAAILVTLIPVVLLYLRISSEPILQYTREEPIPRPRPHIQHAKDEGPNDCDTFPSNVSLSHPICLEKLDWLREGWHTHQCYSDYGIDGSTCSFRSYLSLVESHCPPMPGQQRLIDDTVNATGVSGVDSLFDLMTDNPMNYKFMRERIARLWPRWMDAVKYNNEHHKKAMKHRKRLNIVLHLGFLMKENKFHFGQTIDSGSPLGELVQWADLMGTLHSLGHRLFISSEKTTLTSNLGQFTVQGPCPTSLGKVDLIVTDIIGLRAFKPHRQFLLNNKCRIRILDSFGTHAEFNDRNYFNKYRAELGGSSKNPWGGHGLNLQQYWTFYPHTPDNSFLGFVVDNMDVQPLFDRRSKNAVLIYGKALRMWEGMEDVIENIKKKAEIHATVSEADSNRSIFDTVVNHGILQPEKLFALLRSVKLFIGTGFPFEGPAALEAIAHGAVFINAKFKEPQSRKNNPFFAEKPTSRAWTSQCPYFEEIGAPYSYTVNIHDAAALNKALDMAFANEPPPLVPEEFTARGMLLRVSQMVSRQNFCADGPTWPPKETLKVIIGKELQSCEDACSVSGLICEPSLFKEVNQPEVLKRENGCKEVVEEQSVLAPLNCILQHSPILYSCASKPITHSSRICPCREWYPGHKALCKECA